LFKLLTTNPLAIIAFPHLLPFLRRRCPDAIDERAKQYRQSETTATTICFLSTHKTPRNREPRCQIVCVDLQSTIQTLNFLQTTELPNLAGSEPESSGNAGHVCCKAG
jgi:hypothetical protein